MMQRWCWRLRSLAALHSSPKLYHHHLHYLSAGRLLHTSPNLFHKPPIITRSLIAPYLSSHISASHFPSHMSQSLLSLIQVRSITAKQRKRKLKSRRPMTPVVSKVKKIKIKGYSSFKGRFRVMHDGKIRRWKEGKRHNAHLKSKKSKRRLRQPGIVPAAYAKVMKKLNFCG
ncbi:Ribosomal protein L35 [Perilla frutescens var. hirtella]|nr:Ribosomal protein L35 [Perilla frutescens var. hirtella]